MKKSRRGQPRKPVKNLAEARWQKDAPQHEKSAAGSRLVREHRWKNRTAEERAAEVPRNGGRPRSKDPRCDCGNMTLHTAQQRADAGGTGLGHKRGCSFYRKPT